ncbi:MAG: hypothetical protein N2450_02985 [bacterium]|nr:hypothetical protein [bacterium]
MSKYIVFLILCLHCFSFAARYAGEFLELGVGPRQLAMGGAVATGNQAGSFYWNPSLLSRIKNIEIHAMYVPLFEGLGSYHVAGAAMPITGAAVGIHWLRVGIDDIPIWPDYTKLSIDERQRVIRDRNGLPIGVTTDREDALFFTFAKLNRFTAEFGWSYFSLPIEVPIGLNVKLIRMALFDKNANGIGVDGAVGLRLSLNDLFAQKHLGEINLSVVANDFTKTGINWGSGVEDAIPLKLRYGLGYEQPIRPLNSDLIVELNTEKKYEYYVNWGAELTYLRTVSFRMGLRKNEFVYGVGVKYWKMQLDYTYQKPELGTNHWIGVSVGI